MLAIPTRKEREPKPKLSFTLYFHSHNIHTHHQTLCDCTKQWRRVRTRIPVETAGGNRFSSRRTASSQAGLGGLTSMSFGFRNRTRVEVKKGVDPSVTSVVSAHPLLFYAWTFQEAG